MRLGDPLSVSMPAPNELLIERLFAAPQDLVWACHTQPPLIRRWLTGPDGWSMPVCRYDARAGGTYRFEWLGPADAFLAVSGTLDRVEPVERLESREVFDEDAMGGEYASLMHFLAAEGGTLLRNRFVFSNQEHRDRSAATGMAEGMEQSFGKLDRLLEQERGVL